MYVVSLTIKVIRLLKNRMKKSILIINNISERLAYLILYKQSFHYKLCDTYFITETNYVDQYTFIANNTKLAIT